MSIPQVPSKSLIIVVWVAVGLLLICLGGPKASADVHGRRRARVIENWNKLPASFEANEGQTDRQVKFLARGSRYVLFLTRDEAVLSLTVAGGWHAQRPSVVSISSRPKSDGSCTAVLRIRLERANTNAKVSGIDELPGKSNYFVGNDPAKWRRNIATFGRVKYQAVYPGVDLVYYGNQRQLEYDFVLAPGADPQKIELSFAGAERLRLDEHGNLVITIAGNQFIEHAPLIYQVIGSKRRLVAGSYELKSVNKVGFKLAAYNHREPLTIDPSLAYSTYLGGNEDDNGFGVAVDSTGNAYVTGNTDSTDFPTTTGSLQQAFGGILDAFVSKLNSSGSALVYSTYLGGSDEDDGLGIAVDSSGDAFVTGHTDSPNFPTTPGALQTIGTLFVSKLNSTGSDLIYSTHFGGSGLSIGSAIAVGSSGNAYVTGPTDATDFPTTAGALQTTLGGSADAFVSKLNSSGSALVYSTYLGGRADDEAHGIAVDTSGNAYVAGSTTVNPFTGPDNFPTTAGAFQTTFGGGFSDAFVSKLNSTGSALVYSTYLGGSDGDQASAIAVDLSGNAYVTGGTLSKDFPTTAGALQTTFGGGINDAFVSKLDTSGSALLYSTYLGGSQSDGATGIAVDSSGSAYVTGTTCSTNFPTTTDAVQTASPGNCDAYASRLNGTGSALLFSTYLGGSAGDAAAGVAVDSSGSAYITGSTDSSDFPVTAGALQTTFNSGVGPTGFPGDAFVSKFSFCTQPSTKSECKNGGWRKFCEPSFNNQGQCVAFVNHHQ